MSREELIILCLVLLCFVSVICLMIAIYKFAVDENRIVSLKREVMRITAEFERYKQQTELDKKILKDELKRQKYSIK